MIISAVTCFDLVASSRRGSGCITVLTFKYNGVISISKQKICRYGLILPKKAQQLHPVLQKPSVFGNDSDDDDDETSVSESLQREAAKKQAMKQVRWKG